MNSHSNTKAVFSQLAKAVSQLAGADAITVASGVVLVVVLAKFGGAETLGVYATIMGWFTVVDMLADAGTETHVARSSQSTVLTALLSALRIRRATSVFAVFAFPFLPFIADVPTELCLFVALWFPLRVFSALILAELRVRDRFNTVSVVQGSIGAAQFLVGALAFVVADLTLTFVWLTIMEVLRLVVVAKHTQLRRNDLKGISKAQRIPFRTLVSLAGVGLQSSFLSRAGVLFLSISSSMAVTGVYSAAHRVISVARIVPGALYRVLVSRLQDHITLRPATAVTLAAGIGIVGSLSIAVLANVVVSLLYSESIASQGAVAVLHILSGVFTTQMVIHVVESFLIASHRENEVSKVLFYQLVFVVVALGVLLPALTVQAVAWIILVADVLAACMMLIRLYRSEKVS